MEGSFSDDVWDDAGKCRVGIFVRREVKEANGDNGDEAAGY